MRKILVLALLGLCFYLPLQAQTEGEIDTFEQQMRMMQQQMQEMFEQLGGGSMMLMDTMLMDTTFMLPFGQMSPEDMEGFDLEGQNFSYEELSRQMQQMLEQLFKGFDTEEGEAMPFFWDLQPVLPDSLQQPPKRNERKIKKL